jgi:hypothetical protein
MALVVQALVVDLHGAQHLLEREAVDGFRPELALEFLDDEPIRPDRVIKLKLEVPAELVLRRADGARS